jgi:hypothetical protein
LEGKSVLSEMGNRKLEKGGKIRKRGLSVKSLFANSFCSENGAFFPGFEEDHLDLKALQMIAGPSLSVTSLVVLS